MAEYSLDEAKSAASDGRLVVGGKHFMERVLPWIRDPLRVQAFACDVVMELQPTDFCSTIEEGRVKRDEYGIALSEELQHKYDVEGLVTWYVKFHLHRGRGGQSVMMASLHEPEWDFDERRAGGPLPIEWNPKRKRRT